MNEELSCYLFTVDDREEVVHYRAADTFTVDGIEYDPSQALESIYLLRPMIQLRDDEYDHEDHEAEMFHSDPPTEAELDRYVTADVLPPS